MRYLLAATLAAMLGCAQPPSGTRDLDGRETDAALAVYRGWEDAIEPVPSGCWDALANTRIAITGESDFREHCLAGGPDSGLQRQAHACMLYDRCWYSWANLRCGERFTVIVIHESVDSPLHSVVHETLHILESCHPGYRPDYGHSDPIRWHDAGETTDERAASVEGRARADLGI